jgi:hypothetical protein
MLALVRWEWPKGGGARSAFGAPASAQLSLVSLLIAIAALTFSIFVFHREVLIRQQANLPDFYFEAYLDRPLRPPEHISAEVSVTGAATEATTLKDLRRAAMRALDGGLAGPDLWATFEQESIAEGTWQNRLAYELSVLMERLAVAVLTGPSQREPCSLSLGSNCPSTGPSARHSFLTGERTNEEGQG